MVPQMEQLRKVPTVNLSYLLVVYSDVLLV